MDQSEIRIGEQVILKAWDKDDTDKIVTIVRWHADLMPDSANIKFDDGAVGTFDISRLERIQKPKLIREGQTMALDKKHLEIYARLRVNIAISEATIKSNPLPYLAAAADRIHDLETAIRDALIIMSGADNYDLAREIEPRLEPSMVETALIRNKKSYKRLHAALAD